MKKTALFATILLTAVHAIHGQRPLTPSQQTSVEYLFMAYAYHLSNYARKHDSNTYDLILGCFDHRDVKVYNDLASGSEETSIYNYLTQIDLFRPGGHSIDLGFYHDYRMTKVTVNGHPQAQVVFEKRIRGGKAQFYRKVTRVMYISLENYRITRIFNKVPKV